MLSRPWGYSVGTRGRELPVRTTREGGSVSSLAQMAGQSIQRSPNVVSRVVANEAIVVPIRRGAADMDSIFTFNESGSMLWALIEDGRSAADLCARLQAEYGLSAAQAEADTEKVIADLSEAGLIELQ